MKKQVVYIEHHSTDPAFNLAMEQYVFDSMSREKEYFWLWQNDNTIVVGKHQNTVQEINQSYVKEHGIRVVRRLSGGGAVYHDLGNVNFTFIADAGNLEQLNLQKFTVPVVNTLKKIGIEAQANGRNDISIDGKKFSGNSQYIKQGRIMHHGTLMFDSDLSIVQQALHVSAAKYESKGFKSVRSRVTNIRPYAAPGMTLENFIDILKNHMIEGQQVEIYHLTPKDIAEIIRIKESRYDTWKWNYGASPKYTVVKAERVEGCGQIELYMNVEEGLLKEIQSYGDFFGNGMTLELAERLMDCPLQAQALQQRLEGVEIGEYFVGLDTETFISMILG